jgi:SAM-dependent methyltransferase
MNRCRACASEAKPKKMWSCPEMMRGSGESFDYAECDDCGSLWLPDPPPDMASYYGAAYYSFGADWRRAGRLRRLAKRARDGWQLWGTPLWGGLVAARGRYPELDSLKRAGIRPEDKVLDIGCGDGLLVSSLADWGLEAAGVDPFLERDETLPSGARLFKRALPEASGHFDFVTFNHSLEHMADPFAALKAAFQASTPQGRCLVRVPTCSSEAWRRFGTHWIQLDPPRHLTLFSRLGLERLGAEAGWCLKESFDDSGSFQFWGSLLAQEGIPLASGRRSRFSPAEIKAFEAQAADLNRRGEGDSVAMLFVKP